MKNLTKNFREDETRRGDKESNREIDKSITASNQ